MEGLLFKGGSLKLPPQNGVDIRATQTSSENSVACFHCSTLLHILQCLSLPVQSRSFSPWIAGFKLLPSAPHSYFFPLTSESASWKPKHQFQERKEKKISKENTLNEQSKLLFSEQRRENVKCNELAPIVHCPYCDTQIWEALYLKTYNFSPYCSVQLLSRIWLFVTPRTAACQASLSITNSRSLLKLMSIEWVTPSNHLILCHPLLLLPSIFPSIRTFSHESVLRIRRPKYWSSSFCISPSSEYSGLIPFRMDWLDLLAVQGALKSLLQHQVQKHMVITLKYFCSFQQTDPYQWHHSLVTANC